MTESPNCDACGYCGDDDVLAPCTCDPCDFQVEGLLSSDVEKALGMVADQWRGAVLWGFLPVSCRGNDNCAESS